MTSRVYTTEQFVEKARIIHAEASYDYSEVAYIQSNRHVKIVCGEHGAFLQTPNSHLNGRGCPGCRGNRIGGKLRQSGDDFIQKARALHDDRYDYSRVEYRGNKVKVRIICREHGEFLQTPANHMSGQGCPVERGTRISLTKRSTREEFLRKAREVHGDRYDYSPVEYVRSGVRVGIVCPDHGMFLQIANDHLSGCVCPQCGDERRGDALRMTRDEFLVRAAEAHGDRYDYSRVIYKSAHEKVTIVCGSHGEFQQTPANHLRNGNGCPICVDRYSSEHQEVDRYLTSLGLEIQTNTRAVIPPLELDTFVPDHNLGIEFNGSFWHSVNEDGASMKFRHRDKYLRCREKGIRLLQIDQHEWRQDLTKCIWISMLRSRLGLHERKVHARKTHFRPVSPLEANRFLSVNHLQGTTSAVKWCFGLFSQEEMVAVMTFAGHEKTNLNLTRMAFALDTTVVGGAGKLFSNALPLLPDRSIVTFANHRYSHGSIYATLGFQPEAELPPSYQWLFRNKVMDKRLCRHKHLPRLLGDAYDPTLTEHQNMFRAGGRCLFDAGYTRWVYGR